VRIRDLLQHDFDAALALNNSCLPALNEIDAAELAELVEWSAVSLAAEVDGALAGFCIVLPPGVGYQSLNYQWFSRTYDDFAYLDRIAVSPERRRLGIGRAFYADLRERLAGAFPILCCEVNVRPRNDASLAFHAEVGFSEVGQQDTAGGTKRVSLLRLDL
jgi:uncharacterized protein